ncbi:IS110 family transposase [Paenibacillus flagellatus]|uniref:IS110 family transposase n=1 Tax=Paenibacillus flagellatus TaxID=2211139 RepID=A0A2V5JUC7_9BACL|nr:IS110 family transposase [Paenibacillus flagellatus]PYI49941.1 IS110 family transposase [Paenibacillus flagellatus]
MKPVIGIDVSKCESEGYIFLERNKPYEKAFRFLHTHEEITKLNMKLEKVEELAGAKPAVVLESTGHYHLGLVGALQKHGYEVIVLNPLISQRARKSKLRKVKTDSEDAKQLAELYYRDELKAGLTKRSMEQEELRFLSRQHQMINHAYVQAQLHFQSILDQVFPLYTDIFGQLFSVTALEVLKMYPTPEHVLTAAQDELKEKIVARCNRSDSWASTKAAAMIQAARNSLVIDPNPSQVIAMRLMINLLMEYQSHLANLEQEIKMKASCIPGYELLCSIPGIGPKLAATILAEIGDISSFEHSKKLVAFAGIDPSVFSSGKFTATRNRITKRGSTRLRRALYLAVLCGIRGAARNQRIRLFYDQKRLEGKPHRVALIACTNKLLRIIYALLKNSVRYCPS